ncbi:hypothetical protein KDL45_16085 [bacterium]|nr:hypothetical protein [bacterium]
MRVPWLGILLTVIVAASTPEIGFGWEVRADLPESRTGGAMVSDGKRLYYIGGNREVGKIFQGSDTVWAYNANRDKWITRLEEMPERLGNIDAVLFSGKIYIPGGFQEANSQSLLWSSTLHIYDIANDEWMTGAESPSGPSDLRLFPYQMALVDDVFYLTGDHDDGDEVYAYDIPNDKWSLHSVLDLPRLSAHLWAADGKLYLAGGNVLPIHDDSEPFSHAVVSTVMYDFEEGEWRDSAMEDLPEKLDGGANAVTYSSRGPMLWILGGGDGTGKKLDVVLVYYPLQDTWEYQTKLPKPLWNASAACHNGYLHLAGGADTASRLSVHWRLPVESCVPVPIATTTTTTVSPTTTTTTTVPDDADDDDDSDDDTSHDDDNDDVDDDTDTGDTGALPDDNQDQDSAPDDGDDDDSGCGC